MNRLTTNLLRRRAAVVAVALVAFCSLTGFRGARVPVQIRLEGYLDAPAGQVKAIRPITIKIGKGPLRTFLVTKVSTEGTGPSGSKLLDDVSRYKPAFRLTGTQKLLDTISHAGPNQLVKITGNLSSDRYLMLSLVDVAPPANESH